MLIKVLNSSPQPDASAFHFSITVAVGGCEMALRTPPPRLPP